MFYSTKNNIKQINKKQICVDNNVRNPVSYMKNKKSSSALLDSHGWSKKIKLLWDRLAGENKSWITYIHGRGPGKLSNSPKQPEPSFN